MRGEDANSITGARLKKKREGWPGESREFVLQEGWLAIKGGALPEPQKEVVPRAGGPEGEWDPHRSWGRIPLEKEASVEGRSFTGVPDRRGVLAIFFWANLIELSRKGIMKREVEEDVSEKGA